MIKCVVCIYYSMKCSEYHLNDINQLFTEPLKTIIKVIYNCFERLLKMCLRVCK